MLNQTYNNIEIIIIDDGSIDSTKAIVDDYIALWGGGDNKMIRYIYQKNAGAQVARNNGLHKANGAYISFLDSDDEWRNDFIEKTLNKFDEDNTLSCVYCWSGILNKDKEIIEARKDVLEGNIYKEALTQGYITSPTFLICKKECFDTIGQWDENLKSCQDDDICFRLAKYFKFGLIKERLGIYHTDSGNQIVGNEVRYANGWWALWQKYKNEVIENCGVEILIKHYLNCFNLFKKINDYKMQRVILKEIMRLKFNPKYIFMYIYTYLPILYKKDRWGTERIITLFNFIKIKYKKVNKETKQWAIKEKKTRQ